MDQNADPLEEIVALSKQSFMPSDAERFELDKIPGWWVVTHWLDQEGVTLRLKLQHCALDEPNDFECEIRFSPCADFTSLVKGDLACLAIECPDWDRDMAREIYLSFPPEWRIQFWEMARRFSHVLGFMELGASVRERYAGEPVTSRDFFECE